MRSSLAFGAIALGFIILASAQVTRAESTVWTNTSTTRICSPDWSSDANRTATAYIDRYGGPCTATRLWSRNVRIEYNVRVRNVTKGTVISCGSTVVAGEQLSFEFVPHHYTDISWSGVGYSNDTPYGDWIANAGPPGGSANRCLAKDEVSNKIYAPLSVAPPAKSISGQSNLGCSPLSNGTMKCAPKTAGSSTVVFRFGATTGRFYGRTDTNNIPGASGACVGSNTAMQTYSVGGKDCANSISSRNQFRSCQFARPSGSTYTLAVPERAINCRINVIEAVGRAPAPPTINATGGACVAGTPYTLSLRATDPDGDKVRFRIDWDNNGVVDAYAPASGYANSGAIVSASRTFTAGSKTVKVMAEDEKGLTSSWASTGFVCAGGEAEAELSGEDTALLTDDGNAPGIAAADPDLALRVIPSLVQRDTTTKVNWSASGVVSCTVTAPNGDSWSGLASPVGGETSRPITGDTLYTLSCRDASGGTHAKEAAVRILPKFQEK